MVGNRQRWCRPNFAGGECGAVRWVEWIQAAASADINMKLYYSMSVQHKIHFSQILDARAWCIGTDEVNGIYVHFLCLGNFITRPYFSSVLPTDWMETIFGNWFGSLWFDVHLNRHEAMHHTFNTLKSTLPKILSQMCFVYARARVPWLFARFDDIFIGTQNGRIIIIIWFGLY